MDRQRARAAVEAPAASRHIGVLPVPQVHRGHVEHVHESVPIAGHGLPRVRVSRHQIEEPSNSFLDGPKAPITRMTPTMQAVIRPNAPLAPYFRKKNAIRNPDDMAPIRLDE